MFNLFKRPVWTTKYISHVTATTHSLLSDSFETTELVEFQEDESGNRRVSSPNKSIIPMLREYDLMWNARKLPSDAKAI